jgi:hypothetical protein
MIYRFKLKVKGNKSIKNYYIRGEINTEVLEKAIEDGEMNASQINFKERKDAFLTVGYQPHTSPYTVDLAMRTGVITTFFNCITFDDPLLAQYLNRLFDPRLKYKYSITYSYQSVPTPTSTCIEQFIIINTLRLLTKKALFIKGTFDCGERARTKFYIWPKEPLNLTINLNV